ncbi:hypothetical protein ACIOEX_02525 [Streptomyces sp. NPDC087850]|uniref:hypothetical protein n=1 Tax=Streptomyces sp. NPDC087850 TaxID=3365809 RepID=UPI0037F35484
MSQHAALGVETPDFSRHFGVLGAHGGSGASTVTRWLDPEGDTGTTELALGSHLPPHYIPVVVARSTAFGMARAVQLIGGWNPQVPRPYLVVVGDAPLRMPRASAYRMRTVRPRVLGIAQVPYLVRLREIETPTDGLAHRDVQKAARNLRRQLSITY